MRSPWIFAPVLSLACSGPVRSPSPPGPPSPPPGAHRPAGPPRPAGPAADPARCGGDLRPHREVLVRGRRTEIARGGVYATYHGQSTDHFDDGTFAIVLQIELSTGPWLVDARDTAFHPIGEHCVRLVSSSGDRAELDVALQPAHAYDAARCHAACCRDHTPAPDGTIECCFCSDAP